MAKSQAAVPTGASVKLWCCLKCILLDILHENKSSEEPYSKTNLESPFLSSKATVPFF